MPHGPAARRRGTRRRGPAADAHAPLIPGRQRLLVLIPIVAALGCADGTGVAPPPPPPPGSLRFSTGVQPILTANCAFSECHAGSDPQEGMDLSVGAAHASIVNVPSNQVTRLSRVAPGNPDSSYVVLKLEGSAGAVGGIGTRMPLGGALTQAQIDTIRAWIAAGAVNN